MKTKASMMPTFSEFRERLWEHTESRPLLNELDEMYDNLRNQCLAAVNQVAVKPKAGAIPPDSAFVKFQTDDGDGVRVLALRYESVREAISRVFDRRRHRRKKESS